MAVQTFKVKGLEKTPVSPASVDAAMQNIYNQSVFDKVNPNAKEVKYDGSNVTVKNNGAVTGNVNGSVSVLGNPKIPTGNTNMPGVPSAPLSTPVSSYSPVPQVSAPLSVPGNEEENKKVQGADDVMLTEYFATRPNARVVWNDGTKNVYINGMPIPKKDVYLSPDGKAFVSRNLAEQIYKASQVNDTSSPMATDALYGKLYDKLDGELDRLKSGDTFEYDYRKDPSFKAYSDYYNVLADAAVDEALSQLMSRTGGYVNSNALGAAYKARNNFMRELANVIPQLEQQAYERFSTEKQNKANNLNNILTNIRGFASDYTDAALKHKELEGILENAKLDRDFSYTDLYTRDANEDADRASQDARYSAELAQRIKEWEAEKGIAFANLSLAEQELLLKQWQLEQEYGKKPDKYSPSNVPAKYIKDTVPNSGIPLN